MKSALRSIKNEIKKYDEGQRMVRELTSNADEIPTQQQLADLTNYCRNDMVSTPTYDTLWQRLIDYQVLRHVEKALLVIEHLIINGTKKFIRVCLARKSQFLKLSKYVYKIDGSDIGQNVRRRAKYCHELLQKDEIINKTNTYDPYNEHPYGYNNNKDDNKRDVGSYDDYFQTADKEDADNAAKRQRAKDEARKERERKELAERLEKEEKEEKLRKQQEKKKKKKKKKSSKKRRKKSDGFKKQKSAMDSDDNENENEVAVDAQDPFAVDSNDDFFNNNNKKHLKLGDADELFSSSNDDPFWNNPSNGNSNKSNGNVKQAKVSQAADLNKVTSVSVTGGPDDLLDFFSAPPTATMAASNIGNGYNANGNNNGYNNAFTAAPNVNNNGFNNNVIDPFGQSGFNNDVGGSPHHGTNNYANNNNSGVAMTFSAASTNERNRLKQREYNQQQDTDNNADPFGSYGNNNDPFFAGNTNINTNTTNNNNMNNNNNNNADPFAALGF